MGILSSCTLCVVLIAETAVPIGTEAPSSATQVMYKNVFEALEKMDVRDQNYKQQMDVAGAEVVAIIKGSNDDEARDVLRSVRKDIIMHGLMQCKDHLWPSARQARSALTALLSKDGRIVPVVELWKLSKNAKSESIRQAAKQTITRSVCVDGGEVDRSDLLAIFKLEQDPRMRELYAKYLDLKDISGELIENEKSDQVLKVLLARSSRTDTVDGIKIGRMTEIANAKRDKTFVLGGLYLGMRIEDALALLKAYMPDERLFIPEKISLVGSSPKTEVKMQGTEMIVCKAGEDGKIIEFRLPAKLLRRILNYETSSYCDWATRFGHENGCVMRAQTMNEVLDYTAAKIKLNGLGMTDALPSLLTVFGERSQEPIMIRGCKLASQESYGCGDNSRGYEVRYYGECSNKEELRKEYTDGSDSLLVRTSLWNKWINGKGAEEGTLRVSQIK